MSANERPGEGELLLVGSMPFPSVEDVLRECCSAFGDGLASLPDGEVGDRRNWTEYLPLRTLSGHPGLDEVRRPRGGRIPVFPDRTVGPGEAQDLDGLVWHFRLKPGVTELVFDDLHYAAVAVDSYAVFRRLRDRGVIPPGVRFQAGFPGSSSAIEEYFCEPADWPVAKRGYERAVRAQIDQMLETIPANDLAIQFDFSNEVVDLSRAGGRTQPWLPEQTLEEKLERHTASLSELWRGIPDETVLGFHWCYGTWGGWPRTEMDDLSLCVRLTNEAVARSGHRVDYIHMPVTLEPGDAFFAPLRDLVSGPRVFLGLIHHDDASQGFDARLALARAHLQDFGIAGPCGYGRVESAELPAVLRAHRDGLDELRRVRATAS